MGIREYRKQEFLYYRKMKARGECILQMKRHAFGRIMNSVVDRVVVRIVAEVTSRLVFVQQLRLRFSYEHLLTRNLSSGITFTLENISDN
ncbi:hypothetical protein L6452_32915 [Arctium lappa]|uniref:Uncharacterized protein n=1 Tax=Arctium lappa TaxID=4217 RepID=A0ACB8Z6B4_ARCLA|nr:hypothetical protein L6452_32915 [Arctium lappa]